MFFFKRRRMADLPGHERRRSIRHATVIQVAKIRLEENREELCLLRDVSPEGLKAEVYVRTECGKHVEIEVQTGHRIGGRIAWVTGKEIGVSFDEPMPMSAMLAHCSFDSRLSKLRPPRLEVDMYGLLRTDGSDVVVRVRNISQAGLQIAAPEPFHIGTACAITLPGLAPRAAT
ncbi:MAG: hypothetical protein JF564_08795, partial [Sphingomonas sp.]|nr:hypothetical protein [Sphingomonas sp.]